MFLLDEDSVTLVTGATSDIGATVAQNLLSSPGKVILHSRDREKLEGLFDLSNPQILKVITSDFEVPERVDEHFRLGLEGFKISGIVHCVGQHKFTPLKSRSIKNAHSIMNVNFHSPMQVTKIATSKTFRNQAGMSIVWVSSVSALRGASSLVDYSASKAAVLAASRTLAVELSNNKIRVNSIVAGWVNTTTAREMRSNFSENANSIEQLKFPFGVGTTQDIASAVLFLLSDESRWVTGTEMIIDGGYLA
jgi:NAD(P)-dependent dehydrogenase (short-subunit alcohol dehydrogenase family)